MTKSQNFNSRMTQKRILLKMEQFTSYLQSKNLSPATIGRYIEHIHDFIAWYNNEDVINCCKKDLLDYLSYLKNKNQQPISRNNSLISLRHYFDYLIDEDVISGNPTALIKLRGIKKKKLYYTYNPEELEQLADTYYLLEVKRTKEKLITGAGQYLHQRTYLAKMRNYLMLLFFIYQGLRTKEVLSLQTDDIVLHKATVLIQKSGIRGKSRTLSLHAAQIGTLMQYLNEIRPQLETPQTNNTLFLPIPKKDPKAQKEAEASFKGFVKQLKHIDRNFDSFVQLRSSVITHWIQIYGLRKAQYMAGHKSIVSTEEYLPNHIEDLAEDISKFNPF
jgi:site-specific recombinase XerD